MADSKRGTTRALAALALVGCALAATARARQIPNLPPTPPAPSSPAASGPADVLFDLARFVEWPRARFASADAPLVVGILGEDPFGPALDRELTHHRAHGRPIVVRRFRNLDGYRPCHVLFVGSSKARLMKEILDFLGFLGERSVLTVSERADFVRLGGVVRLIQRPDGSGFDFEINRRAADRAHLEISSELLELAKVTPPASPEPDEAEP